MQLMLLMSTDDTIISQPDVDVAVERRQWYLQNSVGSPMR